MPVTEIPLDASTREEDVTILHGKNLLLKLIENKEVKQFLSGKDVEQFLSTEDLCFKGFRETMNSLFKVQRDFQSALERALYEIERGFFISVRRRLRVRYPIYSGRTLRELSREPFPKQVLVEYKKRNSALMKRLLKTDQELLKCEEKIKEFNKNLEVLYPTVILRCSMCGSPIVKEREKPGTRLIHVPPGAGGISYSTYLHLEHLGFDVVKGEFKGSVKCTFCGHVIEREEALRTHIHWLKDPILKLWESNLWLEDYVSRLLRSMQWDTWSHVSVLGASGVRHEVDVLGVKGSYVLVCECKTGHVTRQDVFNFWAKVYDIRSHVSMLALIEQLPEPETREFVVKNPSVVLLENLGEKKKSQITEELRKGKIGQI